MEEKIGLIKGVECKFVKTDPELIEALSVRLGMTIDDVKSLMRYNMFTVKQFAVLAGVTVSHILNKTSVSVINGNIGTELDFCHPFSVREEIGPKFIVRNEKSEKYIKI
jgi:hypothetical protein